MALKKHRRPWPEWSELEERVRARDFVIHAIGPHVFVFARGSRTAAPLSRQVAAKGAPIPKIAAPFPAWITALVGLGCTSAGDLSSAGVLAGDLWPPAKLRPLTDREEWEHGCELVPANARLASRLFILQRNRSGTPLFSDGANVLAWASASRKFEKIAKLDAFLKFCLRHSLAGKDWWTAWTRGAGEPEGIRPAGT